MGYPLQWPFIQMAIDVINVENFPINLSRSISTQLATFEDLTVMIIERIMANSTQRKQQKGFGHTHSLDPNPRLPQFRPIGEC